MGFLGIRWNFYRIHLSFFTLHPLIWSGIFYACNGQFPVPYINALFLCFSAQTVTGLSTTNLSTITGFQQFILFWLMVCGDVISVSWIMVLVRRSYFKRKCAFVIRQRKRPPRSQGTLGVAFQRFRSMTMGGGLNSEDLAAQTINGATDALEKHPTTNSAQPASVAQPPTRKPSVLDLSKDPSPGLLGEPLVQSPSDATFGAMGVPLQRTYSPSSLASHGPLAPDDDATATAINAQSTRRKPTVDFASHHGMSPPTTTATAYRSGLWMPQTLTNRTARTQRSMALQSMASGPGTGAHTPSPLAPKDNTAEQGFGGFPTPLTLAARFAQKAAPDVYGKLERSMSMLVDPVIFAPAPTPLPPTAEGKATVPGSPPPSRANTDESTWRRRIRFRSRTNTRTDTTDWTDELELGLVKMVQYLRKGTLWVGRNSFFHLSGLSQDEIEEVGGVEYGAIRVLTWLVPAYFVGTQLMCFMIFTAYLSTQHSYDAVFDAQPRQVPIPWFAAFQAVSAYTGGGLSLVDAGMVPFVGAKTLVIALGALIVAGNMLMPVFLRLIIWIIYQLLPQTSQHRQYWQFLLDHPRRCFLYLFPSHQTWFLVAVFFFLTAIEWSGFIVLDIGLPVTQSLPTGQRVLAGLFQSFGVRASGFSIVSLASLAPACKFLYIIMMYISAYPIAMAVRGTNVYEERSLGVFKDREEQEQADEPKEDRQGGDGAGQNVEVFSKYLGWHVRQQLAFDIWWLALALLIMNIIERGPLTEESNLGWFNQFSMLFEVVSAYAGVGLSLGIPTENYSFSGALRTGSKIILILVMVRGRHRDLPMSIDRAILLPEEFSQAQKDERGRHIMHDEVAQRLEDEASMLEENGDEEAEHTRSAVAA